MERAAFQFFATSKTYQCPFPAIEVQEQTTGSRIGSPSTSSNTISLCSRTVDAVVRETLNSRMATLARVASPSFQSTEKPSHLTDLMRSRVFLSLSPRTANLAVALSALAAKMSGTILGLRACK